MAKTRHRRSRHEAEDEALLRFFNFRHLPAGPLQETSREFAALAMKVAATHPEGTERTVALRKLLEAKDCAVRSWL